MRGLLGFAAMKAVLSMPTKLTPHLISLLALIFCSVASATVVAAELRITATELTGDTGRARLIIKMSERVPYVTYVTERPYQLIIEFSHAGLSFQRTWRARPTGLVSDYHYSGLGGTNPRVVLKIDRPVLITRSILQKGSGDSETRLILEVAETDQRSFRTENVSDENSILSGVDANAKARERRKKPGRRIVVIDLGHGGLDPGAIGRDGSQEKDIVLSFGLILTTQLERSGRYKVVTTRDDDNFIALRDRVRIARRNGADLFLSVHADSIRGKEVRGATIYTLSDTASDSEAEALARRENRADIIAGVNLAEENENVAGILIDLAQRETKHLSQVIARDVARRLGAVTLMTKRPIRSAGFEVLKAPDVPSILVELGYLSSPLDLKQLSSRRWQTKTATALSRAIDSFFSVANTVNQLDLYSEDGPVR